MCASGLALRAASSVDRLVLDLAHVTFIDSTGIRLILQARDLVLRQGASSWSMPGPEQVMRVLDRVGLTDQLELVG